MTRELWIVAPQNVPYTDIHANTVRDRESILETFPFPFVAKEVRSSMGNGVYHIQLQQDLLVTQKRLMLCMFRNI